MEMKLRNLWMKKDTRFWMLEIRPNLSGPTLNHVTMYHSSSRTMIMTLVWNTPSFLLSFWKYFVNHLMYCCTRLILFFVLLVGTIIKRTVHNNFSGLFFGIPFTKQNPDFIKSIKEQLPTDSKLLVVCQEGLRLFL